MKVATLLKIWLLSPLSAIMMLVSDEPDQGAASASKEEIIELCSSVASRLVKEDAERFMETCLGSFGIRREEEI